MFFASIIELSGRVLALVLWLILVSELSNLCFNVQMKKQKKKQTKKPNQTQNGTKKRKRQLQAFTECLASGNDSTGASKRQTRRLHTD